MVVGRTGIGCSLYATNGITACPRSTGSQRSQTKERPTSRNTFIFRVQGQKDYNLAKFMNDLEYQVYYSSYFCKNEINLWLQFPEESKGKDVYKNELW